MLTDIKVKSKIKNSLGKSLFRGRTSPRRCGSKLVFFRPKSWRAPDVIITPTNRLVCIRILH